MAVDDQTSESLHSSQHVQEVNKHALKIKGTNGTSSQFSLKDLKLVQDAIQRFVCLGLAVWVMLKYNNIWECIILLAISQIDPRGAKDILVRVLKGLISEGK